MTATAGAGVVVAESNVEEVFITGSRVKRKDLVTPAPVTVLGRREIEASGMVAVGDIVRQISAQSNAINTQYNNGGDGTTNINIRGLNANRTLVLVNGRRFVPGGNGAGDAVDLNAIPLEVVERIEVLKEGASAIYGSDAVGGVVNIITKKNFRGVGASAYLGGTKAGGRMYNLSVSAGEKTDKGSFLVALQYLKQEEILAGQRDYARSDLDYDFKTGEESEEGSSGIPETFFSDNDEGPGNAAWQKLLRDNMLGPAEGAFVNDPVNGFRLFNGAGNSDSGKGDLYNFQPENYLLTPRTNLNLWAQGSYELGTRSRLYVEGTFTNRRSQQLLAPEPLFTGNEGIFVSADNVYNPFGRDFFDVRRRLVEAGNRVFSQNVNTFRVVLGVDGTFADEGWLSTWTWDASLVYGRNDATEENQGNLVRHNLGAAIGPSFFDENGIARCGTPGNVIDGCVPLNLFGPVGSITPAMLKPLTYTGELRGFSDQTVASLDFAGTLFEMWNRPVGLALGYQFRDENGDNVPNPLVASGDSTGNKSEATGGGYKEHAGYAELNIPLLADLPGVQVLEGQAALRAFNFNTFGTDAIYKFGGRWQIIKELAVRGTFSRAFRAPNITELYSGQADDFQGVTDPCDTMGGTTPRASANIDTLCRQDGIPDNFNPQMSQLPARVGGNPKPVDEGGLKPEKASVVTAGLVFTPKGKWIEGFSLTIDYFNYNITDAIQPKGSSIILNNCYPRDSATGRSDCNLITRDPRTNFITKVDDTTTNVGGRQTSGIDFGINYDLPTDVGGFHLGFDGVWLHKFDDLLPDPDKPGELKPTKGLNVYDLEQVNPTLRFNIALGWELEGLQAGINLHYTGPIKECENNDCEDAADGTKALFRDVDSSQLVDLYVGYGFTTAAGKSHIQAGINNLFDQDPPLIYAGFLANSDASEYDYIGRWFYVSLRHEL